MLRDLRYVVRSLARAPGLTAALLATVAVGIGTHATVAGFINGLLTRNLALPDAPRVAAVYWREAHDRFRPVPYDGFLAMRDVMPAFESLAAFRESRAGVLVKGKSSWMAVTAATPGIWDVLRVPPALGTMTFADASADPSSIGVVLADRTWRDAFGGAPDVIGAAIQVDGRRGRVVGVAPDWFQGIYVGRAIDLWIPLDGRRAAVSVLGRLRQASTLQDAQAQLTEIAGADPGAVAMIYSGIEPEIQIKLVRLRSLLEWAAALVFLTAAANVAGFLLSRANRRSHETAARVALGATPGRLASLVVADSIVISLVGGALGGLAAFWTASALPALLYTEDAERLHLMPSAWQIAASAAGYSAIMLLCALAPLVKIDHQGPMQVLRKSEGGGSTSVGWFRSALVVAQMFVCVVLAIGTAVLLDGFREALRTARADRMGDSIVAVMDAVAGFGRPEAGEDYYRRAEREVLPLPGVTETSWVGTLPGGRPAGLSVRLEQPAIVSKDVLIDTVVPPGKDLLDLTLKEGRLFAGEDGPFSCRVALVNEEMAARYFGGDALGRSMRDAAGRRVDVVGVVQKKKRKPTDPAADPLVYFYEGQSRSVPSHEVTPEHFQVGLLPASPPTRATDIDVNVASTGYFDAVAASFSAGHGFDGDRAAMSPSAGSAGNCAVAVVNREAAQAYFDGRAVGGAVIGLDGRRSEIVGVVDAGVLDLMQRRAEPMVYFPASQRYLPRMTLIAGTKAATPALVAEITRRLDAVPGARNPPSVLTLEEQLARTSLGPERIATVLVGVAAVIAVGLGLLGAYGIMSDSVRQRQREIALRLALGAQARTIIATVLRDGLRIATAGAAAGLLVSWALVEIVVHADHGFRRPALWAWLACPLVLLLIVLVASILPARWALSVDPLTVTRDS